MLTLAKPHGWIGIDAGASAVKLAQVSRRQGRLRIEQAAIVPRSSAWSGETAAQGPSLQELDAALAMADGARGRRAAGVLSMAVCDVSAGQATPVLAGPTEEPTPLCSGRWQADPGAGDEGWYTLSVSESAADQLCRDLQRLSLECQNVDGMPHALARAVAWGDPANRDKTVAAIDWGHSGALFCCVRNGQPTYVRRLKGCGLEALESNLAEELQIDRLGVCELMASASSGPTDSDARALIADVATPLSERFSAAVAKTLDHLRSHRKSLSPKRVVLFGVGATLGLEATLSDALRTPVAAWTLPGAEDPAAGPLALFGPAAALSALAWESDRTAGWERA